jgi:ATP-dependent DNA ligase
VTCSNTNYLTIGGASRLENRSTAAGQLLEIYRQDEDETQLTVIKCGPGHPDVV